MPPDSPIGCPGREQDHRQPLPPPGHDQPGAGPCSVRGLPEALRQGLHD